MATIKFLVLGDNDISNIYVRLRDGRTTDLKVSTGYTINPKFWSEATGKPKQSASNPEKLNLSNQLENLRRKITDKLNEDKGIKDINKEWLNNVIASYKNPSIEIETDFLIDIMRLYQEDLKTKKDPITDRQISPLTIKNFNTTISRLNKFQDFKKKKYLLNDINLKFQNEYLNFARNNLGLSFGSIGGDFKRVKTVCLYARDKKHFAINKEVESREFKAPKDKTIFVTLNELEIETIKNLSFNIENGYLDNARNWLIIGCWTGCRVNDLMSLTTDNIFLTPKGQKFIKYIQNKTQKTVDIPMHDHVINIIEKIGGFPRPISDVKFNIYIKEVCRLAGLNQLVKGSKQNPKTHRKETGLFEKWELIKSHTCRRSFATNHYEKLSNKLIMAVTGHTTESMLLEYIGQTDKKHLGEFYELWQTEKEEKTKDIRLNNKHA
jgi:integrase